MARKVKSKCLAYVAACRLTPHSTGLAFSQPVNSNVMPQGQAQSQRVKAMVENRSLAIETKHDASSAMKAGSVVAGGVRFEEMNAFAVEAVAHLKPRWLPLMPR